MRVIALYGVLTVNLFAADFTPFDYDRTLPLDAHENEVSILHGARVAFLNFAVTPSVRADGILVTPPQGKIKTGAILWVHSSGVFQQLPDAMLLAQAGAVSLLINPIGPNWDQPAETWRGPMIGAAVSIRRGVDLLLQRSDVDPQRLGFVGHSYGAMMGIDAVASDRRFKAAVFEVGLAGRHERTSTDCANPLRRGHPQAAGTAARFGAELDRTAGCHPLRRISPVNRAAVSVGAPRSGCNRGSGADPVRRGEPAQDPEVVRHGA